MPVRPSPYSGFRWARRAARSQVPHQAVAEVVTSVKVVEIGVEFEVAIDQAARGGSFAGSASARTLTPRSDGGGRLCSLHLASRDF